MNMFGKIVRLQIQRGRMKSGTRPQQIYGFDNLVSVDALSIGAGGVSAMIDGEQVLDIHNTSHPDSRFRAEDANAVSFNVAAHYAAMRANYGERIVMGCAAENILIELHDADAHGVSVADLAGGVSIQTREGALALQRISAAPPCEPFSRWVLGDANVLPQAVKEALQFLNNGTRGFYCEYTGETRIVRIGDLVSLV
jgi:hypothetical protein